MLSNLGENRDVIRCFLSLALSRFAELQFVIILFFRFSNCSTPTLNNRFQHTYSHHFPSQKQWNRLYLSESWLRLHQSDSVASYRSGFLHAFRFQRLISGLAVLKIFCACLLPFLRLNQKCKRYVDRLNKALWTTHLTSVDIFDHPIDRTLGWALTNTSGQLEMVNTMCHTPLRQWAEANNDILGQVG